MKDFLRGSVNNKPSAQQDNDGVEIELTLDDACPTRRKPDVLKPVDHRDQQEEQDDPQSHGNSDAKLANTGLVFFWSAF